MRSCYGRIDPHVVHSVRLPTFTVLAKGASPRACERPLVSEHLSMTTPYGRVTAVLGPTNTGKTHFAIERMLAHQSGMIGLPLRLLAREVYEKVAAAKGAHAVALITGEEKIVPK